MKYITHQRFKELALCGERLNIPYGTEVETNRGILVTLDKKTICSVISENAKKHFARNDDGLGLERGAITYAIAYGRRDAGNGHRFSDTQVAMLKKDWPHFLRQNLDVILFNDTFFAADLEQLHKLESALNETGR